MSKRIVVRVHGGLGNQLHCYAFGRSISYKNNAVLEFDIKSGYWNDPYGRVYLLNNFPNLNIKDYKLELTRIGRALFRVKIKLMRLISKFLPLYLKPIIEEMKPRRFQHELLQIDFNQSPYFIGYWATPFYYTEIQNELRQELIPPKPTNLEAITILEKIKSCNSCSIHYRTYEEEAGNEKISLYSYYKKSIDLMISICPTTTFFIFSDNIDIAKQQLSNLDFNAKYIDIKGAKGNTQSFIDFYLMYSCERSIIGNSTFSWWAAWLSDSKYVIAPSGLSPWGEDWIPDKWNKIHFL